jgi:hypothetical protein
MNVRNLSSLLLSMLTLVVLGCGGGGGDGEVVTPVLKVTSVSGEASKGPIINGDVKIFAINADGTLQSTPLTTSPATVTTRAPFGSYSAVINYEGPVKVVVTGNTGCIYKDEASGADVPFAGKSLSAVVANVAGSSKVSVTPFTEMAVQRAGTTLTPANIKAANTAVATAMGLQNIDIITAFPSTDSEYKFRLAVISQAAGPSADDLTKLLHDTSEKIDLTTGAITDDSVKTKFDDATTKAFDNGKIDKTGVVGSAVSTVTLTTLPSLTANINSNVTISANVIKVAGGAVADDTVVTFTTSAGTVSAVTKTKNGIATATLSGITSPQTVSINATAGNIKSPEININFIDPNSPSTITVADVPGVHFVGETVTLAIKVVTNSGGTAEANTPVTFAITSGSGTLSKTTDTTDANGNASVSLTATSAGVITIKITAADSATGSHTITFNAQPTQVTVKVRTTGTLPAGTTIGGLKATLTASPASGLTIVADPNGNSSDVSATGPGAGSQIVSNTNNVAAVTLALVNTNGIQTGEFATVNYNVKAGNFPTVNDFSVARIGDVIDSKNVVIPGIGVDILSVSIQ